MFYKLYFNFIKRFRYHIHSLFTKKNTGFFLHEQHRFSQCIQDYLKKKQTTMTTKNNRFPQKINTPPKKQQQQQQQQQQNKKTKQNRAKTIT